MTLTLEELALVERLVRAFERIAVAHEYIAANSKARLYLDTKDDDKDVAE